MIQSLRERGFIVVPGPYAPSETPGLAAAYDRNVASTAPENRRVGRTTTRTNGVAAWGPDFVRLLAHEPLLTAAAHIIGGEFELSSFHARTLHPGAAAQQPHIDFKADEEPFPLASFVFMVDDFRLDNGATLFIPGSHLRREMPDDFEASASAACGPAGSMIIFNGSVWHGHGTNRSPEPRRSLQGAFVTAGRQ